MPTMIAALTLSAPVPAATPLWAAAWTVDWDALRRVASLADHNTRVVLLGVVLLGLAGGVVGTLLLLRRRALLSDTISHACLPGVVLAFLLGELWFGGGRSLPWLLLGAAIAGSSGALAVHWLRHRAGVREDAALAMVLSVFFGAGVVLLSLVQQAPGGGAAGLSGFVFGKAASLTAADARWIATLSSLLLLAVFLLRKEFALLCFDETHARVQGWPVRGLDLALMGAVVAVTVTGLQAVGLLLVVALLIIPPAAARFWTDHLTTSMALAGAIGAGSGAAGVMLSALLPRAPAGAVIVLAASTAFALSMLFGHKRGLCARALRRHRQARAIGRDHLLRAIYECLETKGITDRASASRNQAGRLPLPDLAHHRSWTDSELRALVRHADADGFVARLANDHIQLTRAGWDKAARLTRNHRLWELYLLHYADSAAAVVDREADVMEHVVGQDVADRLERLLENQVPRFAVPDSPHDLGGKAGPPPRAESPHAEPDARREVGPTP